jgi:hypothetical protein
VDSSGHPAATIGSESAENFAACWEVLERNVVKTFVDITPKSTIYTPNCGTWASPVISQGFDAFIITPVSAWFYDMI